MENSKLRLYPSAHLQSSDKMLQSCCTRVCSDFRTNSRTPGLFCPTLTSKESGIYVVLVPKTEQTCQSRGEFADFCLNIKKRKWGSAIKRGLLSTLEAIPGVDGGIDPDPLSWRRWVGIGDKT
jgi:hypothetical protein